MKKYAKMGIFGVFMTALLTGCGNNYVKLGEYKGIAADKVICEVSDEELKESVEDLLYEYVTYDVITDRAAKDGDNVNIDYVIIKLDGKEYVPDQKDDSDDLTDAKGEDSEEDSEEDVDIAYEEDEDYDYDENGDPYSGYAEDIIIGEEYVYPEVEQALIGMKTGEKKTVTAKLTDDYVDDDMVGKTAEIEVTLNEITEENLPEYNDTFIKENTDYGTIAEYEAALKEQLLTDKEESYKYESVSEILQTVIDNSTFNGYDKQMYADCEEEYNSSNEQMASMYGMELADYEGLVGIDDVTKKEDILAMVHERQVVEAIAKAEGITIADKDVNEFVDEIYVDYEYESADDFINDYGMDYLKYYLTSEKVYDFLYENAELTEITEEEYNQRLEDEEDYYDEDVDDDEEVDIDFDDEDGDEE